MEGWSVLRLANALNICQRAANDWVRCGLVRVSRRANRNRRAGHSVGTDGLLEMLTAARLRDYGFSFEEISTAIYRLRRINEVTPPDAWEQYHLVAWGRDFQWVVGDVDATPLLSPPCRTILVSPIGKEYGAVLRRLREEAAAE